MKTFVSLFAVLALGCGDGGGGTGKTAPPVTAVTGTVLDSAGAPLGGVVASSGGAEATTDAKGRFHLDLAAGSGAVLDFAKAGYLGSQKRVDVQDGKPTALEVTMIAEAKAQPLDAGGGGTVTGDRGASVTAPPGAFVDASGKPVTGSVDVHLTPLDPGAAGERAAYPGDLRATTTGGQTVLLESFGVLDVTVRQGKDQLQVKSGETLSVRIPAPKGGTAPATVGLWSFDEAKAVWVEEGTATFDPSTGTYQATIGHLSAWNCDQPADATCLRGKATDASGKALPGAYIRADGMDYNGTSTATAAADGTFCVAVRRASKVRVTVIHPDGGGATKEVESGDDLSPVPPVCSDPKCKDIGTFAVTAGQVSTGSGGTIDCGTVQNPFSGTCAANMFDVLACLKPAGKCVFKKTGTMEWENGAKIVLNLPPDPTGKSGTGTYIGPDGQTCGTFGYSSAGDVKTFSMTNTSGQTWSMGEAANGDSVITCPGGETLTLTSEDKAVLNACEGGNQGGGNQTSCELEGVPKPCKDVSTCNAGSVCCDIGAASGMCLPEAQCKKTF